MTTTLPKEDQQDRAAAQNVTGKAALIPKGRQDRASGLIEAIMQPYTLVSLVLMGGGLAISFIDPKGLMLLVVAVVIVLFLRLGYTRRAALREGNDLQRRTIALLQQQNALLYHLARRDGGVEE